MIRLTTILTLLAAVALSGCNLETVTVADASKETKPTPAPTEPAPSPVLPEPEEPLLPEPEEPLLPEPIEPTPEPVVPEPEPVEPEPTDPVVPTPVDPEPEPTPVEPEEKLSVQLAWDIPMQRENGDELKPNEIGGYKIEYRRVGTTNFQTFMVEDGLSDSTEIGDLVQGMYEFRIAAFDADGLFSDYSDIATIQVDANS